MRMRQFFAKFLYRLDKKLEDIEEKTYETKQQEHSESVEEIKKTTTKVDFKKPHKKSNKKNGKISDTKTSSVKSITTHSPKDIRDIMELMEVPIVSLSKNRTTPITYESADGSAKVRVTPHTGHYLASIYDWDIILFVSSKLQESMNNGSDIPPRTLIIPRHEFLKALCKHDGKKEEKDLKASLARLKLTGIETTIHNEDGRYEAGFGFLDRWGYTDRKDVREFKITLSDWLYEITCSKGALLKVDPEYFNITSGLKRFLYRTARKHVGSKNNSWSFSIRTLYDRSGSEQEFKKFKYDLKKAVADNDLPKYFMEWAKEDGKEKAEILIGRYKDKFGSIFATYHPDVAGEVKGKSSNEAYAGKQAHKILVETGKIHINYATISSVDADSIFDPQFFAYLTFLSPR